MGSSASSSRRSPTTARAIATRWRSPPERSSGKCSARSAEPELVERVERRARAASRAGVPSSSSGMATFSAAVSPASRLKSWNTNPIERRRSRARSLPRHAAPAARRRRAPRRSVALLEAAGDGQQAALARAARAHDGDELARARPSGRRRAARAPRSRPRRRPCDTCRSSSTAVTTAPPAAPGGSASPRARRSARRRGAVADAGAGGPRRLSSQRTAASMRNSSASTTSARATSSSAASALTAV